MDAKKLASCKSSDKVIIDAFYNIDNYNCR